MSVLRRLPLLTLPLLLAACNGSEETTAPVESAAVESKIEETAVKKMAVETETQDSQALESKANEAKDHETKIIEGQVIEAKASNLSVLTARFEKIGIKVLNAVPSDIDGLLEVQTSSGVVFSSPTGDFFLAGTLYSLDEKGEYRDILAERQAPINAAKIEAFADQTIEYKADNEKYVVTVFTDTTCGYCVRLHSQMNGYNALGITVRYLAYPRQGGEGQVAKQMATVWASDDPQSAMHDAKVNRKFPTPTANIAEFEKKISGQYQLGRELGLSGTPAIFLPSGELVSGYLPPAQLLQRLEQ